MFRAQRLVFWACRCNKPEFSNSPSVVLGFLITGFCNRRKGIITVDYLLQYRFLMYIGTDILTHPRAVTYDSLEPFVWFWILSLFLGCKFVALYVYFYFGWKVPHILWSSSAWQTSLSVWSFKDHPCGYYCHNFLISVMAFYKWGIVYCRHVPHLVSALVPQCRFCW